MAWNDLSISQRSQLMNMFRHNGVSSLSEMRRLYDLSSFTSPLVETSHSSQNPVAPMYAGGGQIPPQEGYENNPDFVGPPVPYGFYDAPIDLEDLEARQHYAESRFKANQVSHAGAKGPYQIMPRNWEHYSKKLNLTGDVQDYNNSKAVRDQMMKEMYNSSWAKKGFPSDSVRYAKTLAGYNWGSGNLTEHLQSLKDQGVDIYHSMDWIDTLPPETKNYVNFILRRKNGPADLTNEAFEAALPTRFDALKKAKRYDTGGPEKQNWFQRFLNIQTSQPVMPGVATSAAVFNRDIPREESTVGNDLAYTGALLASPLIGTNFVKNMAIGLPAFEVFDRLPTLIGQDRATVQGGNLLEKGFRAVSPDGKFENAVAPYVNQAGQVITGLPVGGFGELFSRRAASGIAGALDRAAQRRVTNNLGYFEPMSNVLGTENVQSFELPEVSTAPIVEQKAVQATVPYAIDDLGGGYMLKSLMRGNPLEKQIGKNGTVSVNNVRALIGKGSKVEQAVVDKVLASEEFAGKKSIDYNKFRKAVQDELITYDRTPDKRWADYGIDRLGIGNVRDGIWNQEVTQRNFLDAHPELNWEIEPDGYFSLRNPDGRHMVMLEPEYVNQQFPNWQTKYAPSAINEETFIFSSPRIPQGSGKHYNPNTLGHSRTYTTADEPDVLHVMESQSDWAQEGVVLDRLKKITKAEERYPGGFEARRDKAIGNAKKEVEEWKKMIETGIAGDGRKLEAWEIENIRTDLLYNAENKLRELEVAYSYVNPQELYLSDNYTSRQIQENLRYAAEKGQKKMRYPTRETAAKIEGYSRAKEPSLRELSDAAVISLRGEKPTPYTQELFDLREKLDVGLKNDILPKNEIQKYENQIRKLEKLEALWKEGKATYSTKLETILDKYSAFPNQYAKLYKGADVRTVTDLKGNTWYEVDVPENYLQQEWAYKNGGKIHIKPKNQGHLFWPGGKKKSIFDKNKVLNRVYGDGQAFSEGNTGITSSIWEYLFNKDDAVDKRIKDAELGAEKYKEVLKSGNPDLVYNTFKNLPKDEQRLFNLGQMVDVIKQHEDAKRIYLGYEPKYGYMEKSKDRPTIGKSDNPYQVNPLLTDGEFDNLIMPLWSQWKTGEGQNIPIAEGYSRRPVLRPRVEDKGNIALVRNLPFLSDATMSEGFDEKGQYISLYDVWDYNTNVIGTPGDNVGKYIDGKPFEIYQRYYLDDWFDIPENERGYPYIAPAYVTAEKASGGKIHIKPENRGKFTALKKRTGKSASWFKAHGTPAQKKMATFALNSAKWHKKGHGGILF